MSVRTMAVAVLVGWIGLGASPALAGLTEAAELEHARANARAGGPLSERDRELLERWGCLSGTDNPFCKKLEQRDRGYWVRPRRH